MNESEQRTTTVAPGRPSGAVDLKCGHYTTDGPMVVFSSGRRLYECPDGDGLQERKS